MHDEIRTLKELDICVFGKPVAVLSIKLVVGNKAKGPYVLSLQSVASRAVEFKAQH